MKQKVEVLIVGGGPAGLACALRLWERGVRDLLILEREPQLGGILRQCIHDGFGLQRFGEALSGPEYAARFVDEVERLGIPYQTGTSVLEITAQRQVTAVSRQGLAVYEARAVVLAMGCRERTRGALAIPGERPCGVLTAGVAQSYINLHNLMVGKNAVILGSGDIGMIMARRLTLEGARVQGVFEVLPYASGLPRNVRQCLEDYNIPLYLRHTVTEIRGAGRLQSVVVSQVDEARRPIPGTEREYPCDTLILSVGLIPENELSRGAGIPLDERTSGAVVDENLQTGVPGIFAAGNVLQVHDVADFVSEEAERMADRVAAYCSGERLPVCERRVLPGRGVGYAVPQRVSGAREVELCLRVTAPMRDCTLTARQGETVLASKTVKKALPAEMLRLRVPASAAAQQGDWEVTAE